MDTTILYLPDRSRQQLFLRRTQFERRLLRDPLPGAFIAALQDKAGIDFTHLLGPQFAQAADIAFFEAVYQPECFINPQPDANVMIFWP